jgi:hypothetical protein
MTPADRITELEIVVDQQREQIERLLSLNADLQPQQWQTTFDRWLGSHDTEPAAHEWQEAGRGRCRRVHGRHSTPARREVGQGLQGERHARHIHQSRDACGVR